LAPTTIPLNASTAPFPPSGMDEENLYGPRIGI
jgi:hypothetical protein